MNPTLSAIFLSTILLTPVLLAEENSKEKPSHCHTVEPNGTFTAPVFLAQDAGKKEATLHIVATFDKSNYGMNFNGYSKGAAGYDIPVGWKVKVVFCNNSAVPHSIIVVDAEDASKINLGETPYFDGASTPSPISGTTTAIEKFEFTVDEAGEFAFACGFPTHSANGHWIFLNVKKDIKEAAFVTPEAEVPAQP